MIFKSYDKKSHYPSTMTMRYFPYNFEVVESDQTRVLKELFSDNLKYIDADNYEVFKSNMINCRNTKKNKILYRNYFAPSKHAFLCEVRLKNVQIKTFGFNCMPLIAMSKSNIKPNDYLKNNNIIVDNGKLIKADSIKLKCTDLDLLSYYMMYDFEIDRCYYLEKTEKFRFADRYIQQTLRYHLVNKNEISLLIKGKKKIEELTDFNGIPIFNDEAIKNYYQMSDEEKESFIEFYYMQTKSSGVNNQYGINVQKIINDNIIFNLRDYKYQKDENVIQGCFGTQTSRDYITGLYITAYARLDLCYMTYIIYNECEKSNVVYWDTDSIKILVDDSEAEKVESLFNWYNEKIELIRNRCVERFGDLFNLGIWENDGNYKFFYSMGAKKYIVCEAGNNNIVVTNSGINKKIFSAFLNEKYHALIDSGLTDYEAFKELLNRYYHPNTNLGADVTGRKIISYPYIRDKKIQTILTDENGKKIKINQYPCALITECDYMLSAISGYNLINKQHYQLCRALQINEGLKHNCNLNYSEVGNIILNSSDEYSDYIIDNE